MCQSSQDEKRPQVVKKEEKQKDGIHSTRNESEKERDD